MKKVPILGLLRAATVYQAEDLPHLFRPPALYVRRLCTMFLYPVLY